MPGTSEWEQQRVEETVKHVKLNEHAPLAEARRKVWQQVDNLTEEFNKAKARCANGQNPVAKEKMRQVRASVRRMTRADAELSAVAKWCVLFRNDPHLARLVG